MTNRTRKNLYKLYLSDDEKTLKTKVMGMYTDPAHVNIADPGHVEGNMVFTYLDAFSREDQFAEYLPDYKNLDEMKEHYAKGGLGDVKCKKFLIKVLEERLSPIREARAKWAGNIPEVYAILRDGTKKAVETTNETLEEVRAAMKVNYFTNDSIIGEWQNWINK